MSLIITIICAVFCIGVVIKLARDASNDRN